MPDIKGDKMKDIIKIILYADEDVYLKIYYQFSNFDEDLNREGSELCIGERLRPETVCGHICRAI